MLKGEQQNLKNTYWMILQINMQMCCKIIINLLMYEIKMIEWHKWS